MVELRDREVLRFPPAAPAVPRDPEAAVVAADDVLRVRRIDPEIVPVPVRSPPARGEAPPAVLADDQVEIGLEEPIGLGRIDDEAREIERPPHHVLALVARLPGDAAVL